MWALGTVNSWAAAGVASLSRAQVPFLLMKDSDLIGYGWGG